MPVYLFMTKDNYPNPELFPDDESHLLFDIGYGYAMLHRIRELLEKIAEELLPEQEPLSMEVREMLEAIRDFNQGRMQSVDQIYAIIGKTLELGRKLESGSGSPSPN